MGLATRARKIYDNELATIATKYSRTRCECHDEENFEIREICLKLSGLVVFIGKSQFKTFRQSGETLKEV